MKTAAKLIGNPHQTFIDAANLCLESGNYTVDEENKEIITAMVYYFTDHEGFNTITIGGNRMNLRKSLLLIGNPGSGKTFIMELFQKLIKNIPEFSFNTITCIDVREYYKKQGNEEAKKARNIFYNDLGFEAPAYSQAEEPMAKVIFTRYDKWRNSNVKTHIDTNLSPTEISDRYGAHTWTRINQMCNIIPLGVTSEYINRRELSIQRVMDQIKGFPKFFETERERDERISIEGIHRSYENLKNSPPEPHLGLGTRMRVAFKG